MINKIKVSVDHRQWLRSKICEKSKILKIPLLQRYFRVGQGPHDFINRLLTESVNGIKFTPFTFLADVRLDVLRKHTKRNLIEKPNIVRLDGIGIDKINISEENIDLIRKRMFGVLKFADGIIFQSQFSKESFEDVFGMIGKPSAVIHNGISVCNSQNKNKREKRFVLGGRYTPRKRITETIDCFNKSPFVNEYRLDVVGDIPPIQTKNRNINFKGKVSRNELLKILSTATGLFHLDWYDWCPNLVLDSISVGTPVMCGKQGGTQEIVGSSGLCLNLKDPKPNFSKVVNSVPIIDQRNFNVNLKKFINEKDYYTDIKRPDLQMNTIARKYTSFITKVYEDSLKSNYK